MSVTDHMTNLANLNRQALDRARDDVERIEEERRDLEGTFRARCTCFNVIGEQCRHKARYVSKCSIDTCPLVI